MSHRSLNLNFLKSLLIMERTLNMRFSLLPKLWMYNMLLLTAVKSYQSPESYRQGPHHLQPHVFLLCPSHLALQPYQPTCCSSGLRMFLLGAASRPLSMLFSLAATFLPQLISQLAPSHTWCLSLFTFSSEKVSWPSLTVLSIEVFLQVFLIISSSTLILCLLGHCLSAPL